MSIPRRAVIAGAAAAIAAVVIALLLSPWSAAPRRALRETVTRLGVLPPLDESGIAVTGTPDRLPRLPVSGWHNGGPLPADSLRGSIVVLAVFSDTHPGALDALPRLERWHEAYARFGVRVIGVHSPEYAFATRQGFLPPFIARLGLTFPIVEDPALQTLGALGSRSSGIQIALADAEGRIQEMCLAGDPALDLPALEDRLRAMLREHHPGRVFPGRDGPGAGLCTPPRVRAIRLGSSSVTAGPLRDATPGRSQPFTAQFRFEIEGAPDVPYPVGWWIPRPEGIEAAQGGAAHFLAIRYDAPRVAVVASPPASGAARLWILRDDEWLPDDALGADTRQDARGASYIDIDEPRLYFIVRGSGEHVIKISPEHPGLTLHAVTFIPDPAEPGS
jgi:hypothetical protein